MKYAINSLGEAVAVEDNQSIVRFLNADVRFKELRQYIPDFTDFLAEQNIMAGGKAFTYMVQPLYTTDRLIYFAKTEFSSSSQAVKLANEIEKHPEILASKEKTEFMKSIFPDDSSGKKRWYFLTVGFVAFERNLYDGKKINMKAVPPVPYASFMSSLQEQLITAEDIEKAEPCPRFMLKTDGFPLQDTKTLLSVAFERDISEGQHSLFDEAVQNSVSHYMQSHGFRSKDKTSNRAISCLSIINDNKESVFPVYEMVKNAIKKTHKGAYGIRYKGNEINAHIDDERTLTIFVSGTAEKPQFIVGGAIYASLEALKEALITEEIFKETKWFAEKVKPNIREKSLAKSQYKKGKDEIGWTKKKRKSSSKSRKEKE